MIMFQPTISPSILSANFGELNAEIATIDKYVEYLHVDVMDAHFVPNLTIGPVVIKDIKSHVPLDCHLMISNPINYIENFAKAGASSITFHIETVQDPQKLIDDIKALGCRAGVSIKPNTAPETIRDLLSKLDLVLVMTVEPGFGGQSFMPEMLPKIKKLRNWRNDLDIQVDGGINMKTAKMVVQAGANTLIAGSYIFKAQNRIQAIKNLKESCS